MNNDETLKSEYLRKYKRENLPGDLFGDQVVSVGKKIVNLMKQEKEGITYDQAYASLQYAYDLLKYESNFVKLN
ncbi:hypothetical protein [Lapidilactobacillus gannanensis]|uniref:DUF3310 domain-containing protein n=1 Tax=Lapidilactobacillus gannanensis TaxID=2486002 RepID=A0ABW4BK60_9LACO|nr:hypothetical protein [Lapidilactobacillus gannanensis]